MSSSNKIALIITLLCASILIFGTYLATAQNDENDSEDDDFLSWLSLPLYLIIMGVSSIIAILICVWLYRDAEKRGKEGLMWVFLLIFINFTLPFIGLAIVIIIWLFVREDKPIGKQKQYGAYPGQQTYTPQYIYPPQHPLQTPPNYGYPTQKSPQYGFPQRRPYCPRCHKKGEHVDEYNDYYCWTCQEYFGNL